MALIGRVCRKNPLINQLVLRKYASSLAYDYDRWELTYPLAALTAAQADGHMVGRGVQWVFIGSPGVDKSAYANKLAELLNVPYISMGNLVREELRVQSSLSKQLSAAVSQGKLLPDNIIFKLLSKRWELGDKLGETGFVLDGFPRTRAQAPPDKPVPNATLQVTGAVGWRREGLVYKKNEVFLDIVESVNLLMSSKGSVLRCDVTGKILMKCFLSGMPDLKLGLNDKIGLEKESQIKARPTRSGKTIELDDVTFHQCVNLTRFNSEKTVSFVPPDGEFELMKYRITEGVSLPFRVLPTIKELGRTRLEVNVKVKSAFGVKMFAMGVVVKVPVPKQTAKANFQVTTGRAKYNASIDCLVWKIRKFPGQTEATMSAEVELISTMVEKKAWTRPPIQMEFQVPMFTASGLRVRFLKVWEKNGYNTVEWVRYITRAGSYEIRC